MTTIFVSEHPAKCLYQHEDISKHSSELYLVRQLTVEPGETTTKCYHVCEKHLAEYNYKYEAETL